jgi:Tfp pilus assembly protein PilN
MQQINFFQDEFKKIEPPFSAVILVIVLGYSLVLSLVVTVILMTLSEWKSKNFIEYKNELSVLVGELEVTKKAYPAPLIDTNLVRKIETLEDRQSKNLRVLKYLATRKVEVDQQSFSVMLSGLSKVQQPNLWLTQVRLYRGGNEIELTGRTLSAAALPEYLKKLSTLNAFSEMEFEVFDMKRTESGLFFVVSSKRENNDAKTLLEKISQSR